MPHRRRFAHLYSNKPIPPVSPAPIIPLRDFIASGNSTYFLSACQVRTSLGLSKPTFQKQVPYWALYGIPEPVQLSKGVTKFRVDDLYPAEPTWLDRLRAKQKIDFAVPAPPKQLHKAVSI